MSGGGQGHTTNTGSGSVYGGTPLGGSAPQNTMTQQGGPFGNVYSPPSPSPFGMQPQQQPNPAQDPSPFMQPTGTPQQPQQLPQQNGGIASLGAIGMQGGDQSFIVHGQPVAQASPMNQTQPYGQGIGQPTNMPFTDSPS